MNVMFNFLTFEAFTPRNMMKIAFDVTQQSAEVFRWLTPGQENRLALQEFKNKLEAFNLFEYVDFALDLPSKTDVSLGELVEKAEALGPYFAVWAMEGLGHHYAETFWEVFCHRRPDSKADGR